MNRINTYMKEAVHELVHKVTWPTWQELQSSAIVVMIASLIIAALIFVMDVTFQGTLNFLYKIAV